MSCPTQQSNYHGRTYNRKCDSQPIVLDNFGVCGGVGAHSQSAASRLRSRATRSGGSSGSTGTSSSSQRSCPLCVPGESVLNSSGGYNCNTRNLTRKQEKDNLLRMFPVSRPIYIRRPNNWYIHRR